MTREWTHAAAVLVILAASCLTAGCGTPTAPSDTVLIGTVVRGPVQPVCRVDVPCDTPFSATFTVEQRDRVVATFLSDSKGHFEVRLAPGSYLVIPAATAPVIFPSSQGKEVTVGSNGPTTVVLHFDTGIR